MMLDIVSAPTTSAWLWRPVDTSWLAVASEKVNPEQAPARSKPQARLAPILCWMRAAVLGKNMSGVVVPTTMRSMSSGVRPACAIASRAASLPMSEVATPGSTMWRSRMPVRWRIQSLEVSTIFSRSLFVRSLGGTYVASEVISVRRPQPMPGGRWSRIKFCPSSCATDRLLVPK